MMRKVNQDCGAGSAAATGDYGIAVTEPGDYGIAVTEPGDYEIAVTEHGCSLSLERKMNV